MGKRRVIYQEWIVELGYDPSRSWIEYFFPTEGYNHDVIAAVNRALRALDDEEASFIRTYYLQGASFRRISEETGMAKYKLESLHHTALKKLVRSLHILLGGKYNIPSPKDPACPLCNHPQIEAINSLIQSKSERETWKRIIRALRDDFGIILSTPQRLIGHQKFHMI